MKSAETVRRTKKKKRSISKVLIFTILTLTVIISLFTLYATWLTKDTTPLTALVPCVFAEMGVVSAFYQWKSKCLAVIEMKQKYGEQFIENTLDDI